jgi:hypothetical protein
LEACVLAGLAFEAVLVVIGSARCVRARKKAASGGSGLAKNGQDKASVIAAAGIAGDVVRRALQA